MSAGWFYWGCKLDAADTVLNEIAAPQIFRDSSKILAAQREPPAAFRRPCVYQSARSRLDRVEHFSTGFASAVKTHHAWEFGLLSVQENLSLQP